MLSLAVTNDTYYNVLFSPKTWCYLFGFILGLVSFFEKKKKSSTAQFTQRGKRGVIGLVGKNEKKEKCFLSSQDFSNERGESSL